MHVLPAIGDLRGGESVSIELNSEQRAAAECLSRPVLVTAGAGSG